MCAEKRRKWEETATEMNRLALEIRDLYCKEGTNKRNNKKIYKGDRRKKSRK